MPFHVLPCSDMALFLATEAAIRLGLDPGILRVDPFG